MLSVQILTLLSLSIQILRIQSRAIAQSWVYSSEYDILIPKTDMQGLYSNIQVAKKANLIFVASGVSGIKVFNPQKNYTIQNVLKSNDYIEAFAVTQDANYIFLPINGALTIVDYTSRTNFKQISQDSAKIQNMEIVLNHEENILFLLQSDGKIRALNVSNKYNPTVAGSALWHSTQIFNGLVSYDDKWLFVCQGQKGLGIYQIIYNKDGTITLNLAGAFLGNQSGSYAVEMTTDLKYIVNIDNQNGVSIGDFTQISNSNGTYVQAKYIINIWWPTNITLPAPYSLCLSSNNNFLFMGVLAQGIFIIDISNKSNPQLYQQIIVPFQGESIKLSIDESHLYYANGQSFLVFPKITPNLNNQYLNLFNKHQASTFSWSDTYRYWRCQIDDSSNLYYGSFDDDGLWILDISNPHDIQVKVKQFKPPNSTAYIDNIVFLNGFQYILVPVSDGQNVLSVYETSQIISKKSSAKPLQMVSFPTDNYIVDSDYKQDLKLLVAAVGNSVVFIDVSTIGKFFVKSVWQFEQGMKGTCTGIMFTNGNQYVIGSSRGYGYFILDISDFQNIKKVQYVNSLGAENLDSSTISSQIGYFIDGLQGVIIVDFSKLPQISIISQIQLPGWSNDITFVNDEKLMLVSTLEKGMLYMVDISDIKNPFIVSEYTYQNQNGMSSCTLKDYSYLFVNNNIGIISLPTIGQVLMHVEVEQILGFSSTLNDYIYQKRDIQDSFFVGTSLNVDIVFLYQPLDLVVNSVWYYKDNTLTPLPDWITYDPDLFCLKIHVVKESIDQSNLDSSLLNVIVLKTIKPLYEKDFYFQNQMCLTDDFQNFQIYNYLLQNGYIDDQNLVNPNLKFSTLEEIVIFPNTSFEEQNFNMCISDQVKQTLLNSIQYSPIYLFFKTSLTYNKNPENKITFIETVAANVSINIIVQKLSGKFITKSQSVVNVALNDEQNNILISGSVDNVNNYLSGLIVFFVLDGYSYNMIQADIVISDQINYDLELSLYLPDIKFMKEKSPVVKNESSTLQQQLNHFYSGGSLQILTQFSFQISQNTFLSPDVGQVTYTAYINSGGEFVLLDSSYWIQFDPQGNKFYGMPPQNAFDTSIKIQVVGTDGYSSCSDTFEIYVDQLPLLFVLRLIVQILGPVIGAVGMYKYREIFYNSFFKTKNRYSNVNALVNHKFVLKVPLISQDLKKAKHVIADLIQNVNKEQGNNKKKIGLRKLVKLATVLKQSQEQGNVKESQIEQKEVDEVIEDLELDQKIRKESKINQNASRNKQNTQQSIRKYQFPNNLNADMIDVTNSFKDKLAGMKNNTRNTKIEQKYLNKDGKINMKQVIDDILIYNKKYQKPDKKKESKLFREELHNKKSNLYKCLKLLLARYLIALDLRTNLVSEYIREYGKKNCFLYTPNDWYKQFVKIIYDENLDAHGNVISWPKIQMNNNRIGSVLKHLLHFNTKFINLNTLSSKGINPYLLKQILIADSLGIDLKKSSLFPSYGECLHLKPGDLRSVESFKFAPGGCCFSIKQLLNKEYDPYGPKENLYFPSWLTLSIQRGVIILSGTPQKLDIEEILIRFYGLQGYIYRSFILRVQSVNSNKSKIKSNTPKNQENKQDTSLDDNEDESIIKISDFNHRSPKYFADDFNLNSCQSSHFEHEKKVKFTNESSKFAKDSQTNNENISQSETPQTNQLQPTPREQIDLQQISLHM
ncbi:hypothetical protein ABPG74_021046 [Tetrahymena malaccensis]